MRKTTIKVFQDDNFIQGYAYVPHKSPEELANKNIYDIIDQVCGNLNEKYIKHYIEEKFEVNHLLPNYCAGGEFPYMEIPRGTNTFYLVLYTKGAQRP